MGISFISIFHINQQIICYRKTKYLVQKCERKLKVKDQQKDVGV